MSLSNQIFIAGSGAGVMRRGLEKHSIDLLRMLLTEGYRVTLLKSGGISTENEVTLKTLRQRGLPVRVLSWLTGRHPYVFQAISFSISMFVFLHGKNNFILYTGEPLVYRLLQRWRRFTGKNFAVIFCTGGQTIPENFSPNDILHHVTPGLLADPRASIISKDQQFCIPHFTAERTGTTDPKSMLRQKLKLPADAMVVLSVGAIDMAVKRMDYVIREVASISERKFFLVIVGEVEQETPAVRSVAATLLGDEQYTIRAATDENVNDYYEAADVFVLASLKEGFGLVYIEALAHGLPVIAHHHDTTEYVIERMGHLVDLTSPGNLAKSLLALDVRNDADRRSIRKKFVEEKYHWSSVREKYGAMFNKALEMLRS